MSWNDIPKEVVDLFTPDVKKKVAELTYSAKDKTGVESAETYWVDLVKEKLGEEFGTYGKQYAEKIFEDIVKENIVLNSKRPDGRGLEEIRPIFAKAGGVSGMHHGSGIFYRGGTHILSVSYIGRTERCFNAGHGER